MPSSIGDRLVVCWNLIGAGVEGDSVPILDFLAPDRGVILLLRGVVWRSFFAGDLALVKGSLRVVIAGEGEPEPEPASLGVIVAFA